MSCHRVPSVFLPSLDRPRYLHSIFSLNQETNLVPPSPSSERVERVLQSTNSSLIMLARCPTKSLIRLHSKSSCMIISRSMERRETSATRLRSPKVCQSPSCNGDWSVDIRTHYVDDQRLTLTSQIPFSKRYLKYLTKKFLKKSTLRDFIRYVEPTFFVIQSINICLQSGCVVKGHI